MDLARERTSTGRPKTPALPRPRHSAQPIQAKSRSEAFEIGRGRFSSYPDVGGSGVPPHDSMQAKEVLSRHVSVTAGTDQECLAVPKPNPRACAFLSWTQRMAPLFVFVLLPVRRQPRRSRHLRRRHLPGCCRAAQVVTQLFCLRSWSGRSDPASSAPRA